MRMLLIVSCILVAGIVFSLFISRKLNRPVSGMVQKIERLEVENKYTLYNKKEELLKELLVDSCKYSVEKYNACFKEYNIALDAEKGFFLVVVLLDNFPLLNASYKKNDIDLLNFSVMNIISEVFSGHFTNEPVAYQSHTGVLLVNTDNSRHTEHIVRALLQELCSKAQREVISYLGLSVTLTAGICLPSVYDISDAFKRLQAVSLQRFVKGHGSILFEEDTAELPSENFNYPVEKEKLLINSLRLERLDEAKQFYLEFAETAKPFSYNLLNMAFIRLLTSISMSFQSINEHKKDVFGINLNELIAKINSCEIIEELHMVFYSLFEGIVCQISLLNSNIHYHERNNRITEYISQNLVDPNLSLQDIADKFDVSANYLGRSFKKEYQCSVAEYINAQRMEKAKKLLKETDTSVSEISKLCGFHNIKYFYTLFKKHTGVNASVYRKDTSA